MHVFQKLGIIYAVRSGIKEDLHGCLMGCLVCALLALYVHVADVVIPELKPFLVFFSLA